MKVDEWLLFFKKHSGKKLFSLSDLCHLVDEPRLSVSVQLTRLVQAQVVRRVAQGWYANPFHLPSSEEVAMVLRVPAYISMEYALSRQGVLSQRAYTMTLVTPRGPYTYQIHDERYEYHQIHTSLFWGYEKEQDVLVGTPEKALLDLLYIRGVRTKEMTRQGLHSLISDMDLEGIHTKRVHEYAKRFGKSTQVLAAELGIIKKI